MKSLDVCYVATKPISLINNWGMFTLSQWNETEAQNIAWSI